MTDEIRRWNETVRFNGVYPKVDAFVLEIVEVCKKHQMTIITSDPCDALIVTGYFEENDTELLYAATNIEEAKII